MEFKVTYGDGTTEVVAVDAAEKFSNSAFESAVQDAVRTGKKVTSVEVVVETEEDGCEGHPAGPFDPMGETVYCDGSCVAS